MAATRGVQRTSLVRRRQREHIQTHGPCEVCGSDVGLDVFWRSRNDRPYRHMQMLWTISDERRAPLVDKLVVLCAEHMRVHKGGVEHGGGVTGVKGCDCIPCLTVRRKYVNRKRREYRAAKRGSRAK